MFRDAWEVKEFLTSREAGGLWGRPHTVGLYGTRFSRRFGRVWIQLVLPEFSHDRNAFLRLRPASGVSLPAGGVTEDYLKAVDDQTVKFLASEFSYDQINEAAAALAAKIAGLKPRRPSSVEQYHYGRLEGAEALAAWKIRARQVVLDILKDYVDLHGNHRSCSTKSLFNNLWENYCERPCGRRSDAYPRFYKLLHSMAEKAEIYALSGDVHTRWAFRPAGE